MARRQSDVAAAESFVTRVIAWLKSQNVTQSRLAQVAGVHPTHLNRWVNGHALPSMENITRLQMGMDWIERER